MNTINPVVPATNPSVAVVEQNKQPFISSLVIAEQLGIQHKNVLSQIETHAENLHPIEFIILKGEKNTVNSAFETRKCKGRKTRIALLTHDQAIFLLTLSRNTPARSR